MSITKEIKADIISKFSVSGNNTGSTAVQIALFSAYISNITMHLKANKKDYPARRGLLAFVAKRKRLLVYLKRRNNAEYEKVLTGLKLKKV